MTLKERIVRQFPDWHYVAGMLGVLALAAGTAWAHHGVTGRYDTGTPIVIAGTITRATFAPPHPVLSVRVDATELPALNVDRPDIITGPLVMRPEDAGQVREIEFSPVRMFHELGSELRAGDRVVLIALRNCLAPHQLRSSWIQLPGGRIVSYTGDWAGRTHGCR